jgi:hypothetical protein
MTEPPRFAYGGGDISPLVERANGKSLPPTLSPDSRDDYDQEMWTEREKERKEELVPVRFPPQVHTWGGRRIGAGEKNEGEVDLLSDSITSRPSTGDSVATEMFGEPGHPYRNLKW